MMGEERVSQSDLHFFSIVGLVEYVLYRWPVVRYCDVFQFRQENAIKTFSQPVCTCFLKKSKTNEKVKNKLVSYTFVYVLQF